MKIAAPEDVRSRVSLKRADYQDTFTIDVGPTSGATAERWIRDVFESPMLVRKLIRVGWLMFGAKLGPYPSPDYVAGWRIGESTPDCIRLEVDWAIGLQANLILCRLPASIILGTFVEHRRPASRVLWPLLVPVHVTVLRYLLGRTRSHAIATRPLVIRLQRHVTNPVFRALAPRVPGVAVLETTGRRSGLPRQTPVGGLVDGSAFWLVSEFGRRSNYVRNIAANPRVRLQVKGAWHTGTAVILDADDARERLRQLPAHTSFMVRLVGTDLVTLRIDLDARQAEHLTS
jgi:deazaflavin-dependent oxidoreductase (nitroreductase family)